MCDVATAPGTDVVRTVMDQIVTVGHEMESLIGHSIGLGWFLTSWVTAGHEIKSEAGLQVNVAVDKMAEKQSEKGR